MAAGVMTSDRFVPAPLRTRLASGRRFVSDDEIVMTGSAAGRSGSKTVKSIRGAGVSSKVNWSPMALIWGGEDIISLAKEVVKIAGDKQYEKFIPKGGVMDGQPLAAAQVTAVSKWPSRLEQLSILSGQILSPGAKLSSQLLGVGAKLASQIKKKSEGEEPAAAS